MTGHFTTADGCERWLSIGTSELHEVYRLPMQHIIVPRDENCPFTTPRVEYGYRVYKLASVEYNRGVAHYVEVA